MPEESPLNKDFDPEKPWGVCFDLAPQDWQVLQQDKNGLARFVLSGIWRAKAGILLSAVTGGSVQIRLVREQTGLPVSGDCDWRTVEASSDSTWQYEFMAIPAGGPYRLESRFNPKANKLGEWSLRGDMRHFIGVGDIWILAGQSNASGYGRGPYEDPPEIGLHILRQNGIWGLASHPLHDSTDTVFTASRETYNPGHSPFLHFARSLKRDLGYPIALLPAALGGSSLDAWQADGGLLFANLKTMVGKAGGKVKGMIWYQGESDAKSGQAEDYLERFLATVAGWRKALEQPNLPILTVQLGRYLSGNSDKADREWSLIREAQRQAANEISDLKVIPALDLGLDDTIHIGTAGNLILGERLARCALATVYGRSYAYQAPEPLSIVLTEDKILTLRFSHIYSRLDCLVPFAIPFRVEDANGLVPIEKIIYLQRDSVRLFLNRVMAGTIRVSCGYGENPDIMPMDMERQMPVLAFYGLAATR
jgi:sialate O-acetylesterase